MLSSRCRGWLGRVETSEGDAEAFERLGAALTILAGKQGIRLTRRTNPVRHLTHLPVLDPLMLAPYSNATPGLLLASTFDQKW